MANTLLWGGCLPSLSRCTMLVAVSVTAVACGGTPPTEVESDVAPATLVANHVPWSGCTAWNGRSFATVYFERGSATLDDGDKALLDANIEQLNECPNDGFHVQGEAVREKQARQVALARAQAVADYYKNNGVVNPSRMAVSSYVVAGCSKVWGPCSDFRNVWTY